MKTKLGLIMAAFACILAVFVRGLHAQLSAQKAAEPASPYQAFGPEQQVTILGYSGDAMEPFFTKDGQYLLFNNRNEKPVNTNLFYAKRLNGLTFDFLGEIRGVNTPALEGVPSLDRKGNFYFVSDRSYGTTLSTLYCGHWSHGAVSGLALVPGISRHEPGIVNFDAEISGDGNTLYFVDGDFRSSSPPASAKIVIAARRGSLFVRLPQSDVFLDHVNRGGLNYAPSISENGRELFFTRVDRSAAAPRPIIYRAFRAKIQDVFGVPQQISAITGYAEGPTLSADGRSLYYHKRINGHFVICRVMR